VDGHFLSDSVHPVDMLRISQGAWLRLPPGRLMRWAVLRSAGKVVPRYGKRVAGSPATVLTPCGALWEPAETVDLDFALLAAMPGMLGLSGDLSSLSSEQRARVAEAVAFYKKWRHVITGAVAHLLTPPQPIKRREGWVGVQLQAPGDETGLVFVYRLDNAGVPPPLRLRGLDPARRYTARRGFDEAGEAIECSGEQLMRDGLPVTPDDALAASGNGAHVFRIRRIDMR
jgi:hypothetical protein